MMLPAAASAQGGMPGGGTPGGGMGDGAMGRGPGGGPERGGPGGGKPREMKPVRRDRLDKPVTAMFTAADTNRDGLITLEELRSVLESRRDTIIRARFDRIDSNGDRLIQPDEFITWQRAMGSAASSDRSRSMADGMGPVEESIAPPLEDSKNDQVLNMVIEPLSAMVIVNANSNYDTGLSLEELLAYERGRFDKADSDGDGALSAEEIRHLRPQRPDGRPDSASGDSPDGNPPPQGSGPGGQPPHPGGFSKGR